MNKYTIQVQAQFDVEAETFEDACDVAVSQAMEMESTEWGTVQIQNAHDFVFSPDQARKLADFLNKVADNAQMCGTSAERNAAIAEGLGFPRLAVEAQSLSAEQQHIDELIALEEAAKIYGKGVVTAGTTGGLCSIYAPINGEMETVGFGYSWREALAMAQKRGKL